VRAVGPEHFGIVAIDPAKHRSAVMIADFYGKMLVEPFTVEHSRTELSLFVTRLRMELARHHIRDAIIAIERTGRFHHLVRDACRDAGWDVRLVHPMATTRMRHPANPGDKTDNTDLAAIQRAAVAGFALKEHILTDPWQRFQLLARHRADLVDKAAELKIQLHEHIEALLPGYSSLFDDLWRTSGALAIVRHFCCAQAIRQAGTHGVTDAIRAAGVRPDPRLVKKVQAWALNAASSDQAAQTRRQIMATLWQELEAKWAAIRPLELELAAALTETPYVLLLSIPGVGVVSDCEYAAEAGPIEHYAFPRAISGRAGLYPSRYQSDQTDYPNGALLRSANRRLRGTILTISFCLSRSNHYFRTLAHKWKQSGVQPVAVLVRIGNRFCRISYHMVAGASCFRHPAAQKRDYVLTKLLRFCQEHEASASKTQQILLAASRQLNPTDVAEEHAILAAQLAEAQKKRRGPQPLAELLPAVLAGIESRLAQCKTKASEEPPTVS
jgi:transposase